MQDMTATEIPAERIRPGHAPQRVNAYKNGAFYRQAMFIGTEAEARAYLVRLGTPSKEHQHLTAEQQDLVVDIARLDQMSADELARETGAAEFAALCAENDEDRKYRAELEKRAARTAPPALLPKLLGGRPSKFFDALAALPGSAQRTAV